MAQPGNHYEKWLAAKTISERATKSDCSHLGCGTPCPAGTIACFEHGAGIAAYPYVYFILAEAVGKLKIGWTTNLHKRFGALQTASAVPLSLVGYIGGGTQVERWCHHCVSSEHSHYEWFDWSARTKEFVRMVLSLGKESPVTLCPLEFRTDLFPAFARTRKAAHWPPLPMRARRRKERSR